MTSHASGRNGSLATKLGLSRSGRAEITSTNRSRIDRDQNGVPVQSHKGQRSQSDDASDRGLTDGVILHTRDYTVEYDDRDPDLASLEHDGSTVVEKSLPRY